MDAVQDQIQYFLSRMPTKAEYRAWWPHYKARAELLESEYPEDYAGLLQALNAALKAKSWATTPARPSKPAP